MAEGDGQMLWPSIPQLAVAGAPYTALWGSGKTEPQWPTAVISLLTHLSLGSCFSPSKPPLLFAGISSQVRVSSPLSGGLRVVYNAWL